MNKLTLAAAIAMIFAVPAFADQPPAPAASDTVGATTGGAAANQGATSTATSTTQSNNSLSDSSTNGSYNTSSLSSTKTNSSTNDSNNTSTSTKTNASTNDSYNTSTWNKDSFNTANLSNTSTKTNASTNNSYNQDDHSYTATWVASNLSGAVAGVSINAGSGHGGNQPAVLTGNNGVDNGSLANSAGITQVSLNSGVSAQVQQSVNVQANLAVH